MKIISPLVDRIFAALFLLIFLRPLNLIYRLLNRCKQEDSTEGQLIVLPFFIPTVRLTQEPT
jgi:hypothetical protein